MTRTPSAQLQPAPSVRYRAATEHDVGVIAALHADSWRRHYRGAYLDDYLDGDVVKDRLEVWTARLSAPRLNQYTVCADAGGDVIGFAHTVFGQDPTWGALSTICMYAATKEETGSAHDYFLKPLWSSFGAGGRSRSTSGYSTRTGPPNVFYDAVGAACRERIARPFSRRRESGWAQVLLARPLSAHLEWHLMPEPFDAAVVRAAYDVTAEDYAEAFADDLLRLPIDREVLDSLGQQSDGDSGVLDLGCGPGQVGQYLAQTGLRVVGLDLALRMLLVARRRTGNRSLACGDTRCAPFGPSHSRGLSPSTPFITFRGRHSEPGWLRSVRNSQTGRPVRSRNPSG